MSNFSLYQRFFDTAKLDLQVAKVLKDKHLYQPAIYQLQHAYEKCIKSYYILKEVKLKNTPESMVYDHVLHFGHDTEESTMTLLKDMVTIEEDLYKNLLPNLSDQQQIKAIQKAIAAIDSYKSSLDKSVQALNLSNNYIKKYETTQIT